MRLLEYQIHPSNIIPVAVAKEMFDHQLKENYGHAGEIYCSYLLNNLEDTVSNLLAIQQKIDKEMRLTSKERFWSAVIACNITGGLIARMLGLHNYDMKAVYAWSMQMLTTVRQDIAPPANNAASVIGDFLNRNIQNMLVVNNEVDKRTNMHSVPIQEPRGELKIRYEPDTKLMYIVAKDFKKDCVESQAPYKETLNDLKRRGVYMKADTKQMSKGMRVTSPGVHALIFDCSVPDFIDMDAVVAPIVENASRAD
jgi:hypothetical protein